MEERIVEVVATWHGFCLSVVTPYTRVVMALKNVNSIMVCMDVRGTCATVRADAGYALFFLPFFFLFLFA